MRIVDHLIAVCLLATLAAAGCSGGGGNLDGGPGLDGLDGGDQEVACTSINECDAHQLCLEGYCRPGISCASSGECPGDYECNIIKEVCIPKNPCESDNECLSTPGKPYCLASGGVCVACTNDAHCETGFTCDKGSYICKVIGPECTADPDCTQDLTRPHCGADGKCYACVKNEHCGGSWKCEPDLHRCVECYQSIHCTPPKPVCFQNSFTCVECLSATDCPNGQRCTLAYQCTTLVCTTDPDCANEIGRPKCQVSSGDCVECLGHADCGAYMWCRDFGCQNDCTTDQECVEKSGANYHCNLANGACFYAECLSDADCAGNLEKPHCKTAALPSNPAQYTCVECTDTAHCAAEYVCNATKFVCAPKPCYDYPDWDGFCHQKIDPCYFCDPADGLCKPAKKCPNRNECCRGYTCNSFSSCEPNLNCSTDQDCPIGYTCNLSYFQCEYLSCCGSCAGGSYCDSQTCKCISGCHNEGDSCDPLTQNCCTGLRCSLFWPFCIAI